LEWGGEISGTGYNVDLLRDWLHQQDILALRQQPQLPEFGRNVGLTLGFNLLLAYGKSPNGTIKIGIS
jgi:hypothetical protein